MKSSCFRSGGFSPMEKITPYIACLVALFFCSPASAGRFVNLAETATFPRGEGEVVQVTAFSTCNNPSCQVDALEFQVGVEYGLVDRLQVGFALPNVVTSWAGDHQTTEVGGTARGVFTILWIPERRDGACRLRPSPGKVPSIDEENWPLSPRNPLVIGSWSTTVRWAVPGHGSTNSAPPRA